MQEAAKKAQAAHSSDDSPAAVVATPAAPPAAKAAPVANPAVAVVQAKPVVQKAKPASGPNGNGATAPKPKPATASKPPAPKKPAPKEPEPVMSTAEMNRREFLTYAWGGALGLLALESGVATYFFLYPRFKAGEFGGTFSIGPASALPDKNADPQPFMAGKFWLVTTAEDKPKALYMVCPHLGCLYKWVPANHRFECPCHGSKYTHDGYYIEGPAPRSLDSFLVTINNGQIEVNTGKKTLGIPSAESPARAAPA